MKPKLTMEYRKRVSTYLIKNKGGHLIQFPSEERIIAIWNTVFPGIGISIHNSADKPCVGFYAWAGSGTTPKKREKFCDALANECKITELKKAPTIVFSSNESLTVETRATVSIVLTPSASEEQSNDPIEDRLEGIRASVFSTPDGDSIHIHLTTDELSVLIPYFQRELDMMVNTTD